MTENFILIKAKSTFVFSDFQVFPPIRTNLLPLTQEISLTVTSKLLFMTV